jgi:hypothetical protein
MELPLPYEEAPQTEVSREPHRHDDGTCPWCGEGNQCRVAKVHIDKDACWCHEMIVPNHLLARLKAENVEPSCLCRPCLETIARLSNELDDAAAVLAEARRVTALKHDYYLDENGNVVFTSRYHLKRGVCCDNACRHCPY